jgi:hypothetical protein
MQGISLNSVGSIQEKKKNLHFHAVNYVTKFQLASYNERHSKMTTQQGVVMVYYRILPCTVIMTLNKIWKKS